MKKVTGLGGVFFKTKNPKAAAAWYDAHLGLNFGGSTYQTFKWRDHDDPSVTGQTVFSVFADDTTYFAPSESPFMLNLRVENLEALLAVLTTEGVEIVGEMQTYDYGKFAWIRDLDGNKIELWEAIDEVLEKFDADNKA